MASPQIRKWIRPVTLTVVLGGLFVAAAFAVLNGFAQIGPQDIIRRTPTPIDFHITRTATSSPTDTDTPEDTETPEDTPTPFPTKDVENLGNTVVIGGSTGDSFLGFGTSFIPMFDGGVAAGSQDAGHVVLPGAITHLIVRLSEPVDAADGFEFTITIDGKKTSVRCDIPSKGKGDYCESGDKAGDCTDVRPQDTIAVQALPNGGLGGDGAGFNGFTDIQMSWMAKLDLYGSCPLDEPALVGENSCQVEGACDPTAGRIGDNSCNNYEACFYSGGVVGSGSCNGEESCFFNFGRVGNNSCNAPGGCYYNFGDVGSSSCNGYGACAYNVTKIGSNSCNGYFACYGRFLPVGNNQCNGDGVCSKD